MTQIYLGLLIFFISSCVNAADFDGHKDFEAYNVRGTFRVTCVGSTTQHYVHRCKAYGMHPFNWSRLTHKASQEIDRVVVKSQRADGKTITRRSKWDNQLNQSFKQFNLWVKSLFQTPLLTIGDNQVSYELITDRKTVESGQFEVTVTKGAHYQCKDLSETVYNDNFCENSLDACRYYFDNQNDCEESELSF